MIDAVYEWHWSPLVGAVQGLLRALDLPYDAPRVSAALGEAFAVPGTDIMDATPSFVLQTQLASPSLADDLAALGLTVRVLPDRGRLIGWRRRRRIHATLARGIPVLAFGAGHAPGGGDEFGLIVGFDADRGYQLSGPLTEEVGAWRPAGELEDSARLCVVVGVGVPLSGAIEARARRHAQATAARDALRRWAENLENDLLIDVRGHAYAVQRLAAARGDAGRFWRDQSQPETAAAYERVALTLTRLGTLFPYPVGGDVDSAGGRKAGAVILREAATFEEAAIAALTVYPPRALTPSPPTHTMPS